MRDARTVRGLLEVLRDHGAVTQAPDFIDGAVDALEWVLGDDTPTMLGFALVADGIEHGPDAGIEMVEVALPQIPRGLPT